MPVLTVIWAAENSGWPSYFDPNGGAASQGQVNVCKEFNMPFAFFAITWECGGGSYLCWKNSTSPEETGWRSLVSAAFEDAHTPDDPWGIWLFEDTSGSNVPDRSGNSHNGQLTGGATDTETPFAYNGNKSLLLNGSSDYMDINIPSPETVSMDITIEAYVRPTSVSGERWIMKLRRTNVTDYYALRLNSGRVEAFFGDKTSVALSTQTLSVGTWYHVAATYDMVGDVQIYIDGVADGNTPWAGPTASAPGDIDQGNAGTEAGASGFFAGYLDEVKISPRILTLEEIQYDRDNTLNTYPLNCAEAIAQGYVLTGDIYPDCQVTTLDLGELATDWLACTNPADANCYHQWELPSE